MVLVYGSGNYNVNINVHDLGRHACDGGASSEMFVAWRRRKRLQIKVLWVPSIGKIQVQINFAKEFFATVNNGVRLYLQYKKSFLWNINSC